MQEQQTSLLRGLAHDATIQGELKSEANRMIYVAHLHETRLKLKQALLR